jgi:hypothetical protein
MRFAHEKARDKDENISASTTIVLATWGVFGLAALFFVLVCLRAWVITKLWAWYFVTGFGLAPVTLPVAFGISLLVGYLIPTIKDSTKTWQDNLAEVVINPFVVLFIGWIGTLFM